MFQSSLQPHSSFQSPTTVEPHLSSPPTKQTPAKQTSSKQRPSKRRAPPTNTLLGAKLRLTIANFIRFTLALSLIVYILILADLNKGYQVTKLNDANDTLYQISVEVDRKHAKTYYNWMITNGTDTYSTRDIRLPNGVLTVATVSLEEIVNFLQSGAKTTTISRIWSANDHTYAKTSESDNLITIHIPIHYSNLLEGIEAAKSEPNHKYLLNQSINLPSGRKGCCFLDLDEMEEYRRRMHTQGAQWIILPFYFNINKSTTVNIPLVDPLT